MTSPQQILKQLGFAPSEAAVYLAMLDGHTKVKDIVQITGIKRPSVYYAISQLEKRGVIGRIQVGEYNQWKVNELSSLNEILEDKKSEFMELTEDLTSFIHSSKEKLNKKDNAKVTYYEGQKTIESVVFNSLYCKDKHIRSIAPKENFFFQAGYDYATKYVNERKRRGITTRNLWEELLEPEILQRAYKDTADVRIVPDTMKGQFRTTIFLYDDKVMYIAPVESNYAVVFQSVEHHKMISTLFETIWAISKPAFK